MMPVRVQRKRTTGFRLPPNTKCVSRPSPWGNPFRVGDPDPETGEPMTAERAVYHYRRICREQYIMIRHNCMGQLGGWNLADWCKEGEPCHADVLLEIANGLWEDDESLWISEGWRAWAPAQHQIFRDAGRPIKRWSYFRELTYPLPELSL